jgi:hypothetical protein
MCRSHTRFAPCRKFRLFCTPIKLEILSQVKDKILYVDNSAAFDAYYSHATVLTCPSISVRELDIPVHSNDIGSAKGKDVPDTDVLNIKLDSRELVEKIPKPTFDSALSLEGATCRNFTGVDKNPIIPPSRHELGQVMSVQSIESISYGFLGNKCSDH